MNRLLLTLSCGAAIFLPAPLALAHHEDAPDSRGARRIDYDIRNQRSPQHAAFEFRVGPYQPDVDNEFDGGATPYEDSFGDKPSISPGVELDWQAFRIPYFGTIGPGVGWHWFRKGGTAEFKDDQFETDEDGNPIVDDEGNPIAIESAHPQSLRIMPMYAVAVLRADVLSREFNIPLVPYIKGGFAWSFWKARDAQSTSVYDGEKAKGLEIGWTAHLGLMLLLNPLAPQMAVDMDNASGVNNAYLFVELWKSDVSSFGNGMQVGNATWTAGLALEF